jgi:hypothetical protein
MNFQKGWNKTMSEILIGSTSDPNEATVLPETPEQKAKQLPDPSGYRILCAIPEIEDNLNESGISQSLTCLCGMRNSLTTVLFVMSRWAQIVTKTKKDFPPGLGASRVTLF